MDKIKEIIDCSVVVILNLRHDLDENKIKDTEFAKRYYEVITQAKTEILAEIEKQIFNKTLECSFEQTEYCEGFKEREMQLKQNFDKLKKENQDE